MTTAVATQGRTAPIAARGDSAWSRTARALGTAGLLVLSADVLVTMPVLAALALTIGAISAANPRTWLSYVGFACAAAVLAAAGLQAGAYAVPAVLLWALCQAVALWHSNPISRQAA